MKKKKLLSLLSRQIEQRFKEELSKEDLAILAEFVRDFKPRREEISLIGKDKDSAIENLIQELSTRIEEKKNIRYVLLDANPVNYIDVTFADDFVVFVKMYQSSEGNKEVEDSFLGILSEIELLKTIGKGKDEQYQIENSEKDKLPEAVLLFTILDNPSYGDSIGLNTLEHDYNSPGSIFCLNRSGLTNKISEIVHYNKQITFTDHAGIKELQFKKKPNAYSILDSYYGK